MIVMTEKEFFIVTGGRSENGEPKARVMIETSFQSYETDKEVVVDTINLYGPILNFSHKKGNIIVDIQFDSHIDSNLLKLILKLNKFDNSTMPEDGWFSQINLAIIPFPNEEQCHAEFIGARWDAISSQGSKFPDTLRLIFNDVNFQIYKLMN